MVKSANALFASNSLKIKDAYKAKLNDLYKVYVNSVDFADRGTVDKINSWVGNATRGLINEIVTPGIFEAILSILRVN